MHAEIAARRPELIALCRRFSVARLEVFGSMARNTDFDPARSDADFLVAFLPKARNDLTLFLDFREALEALLGRPIDLVEREAVEASRNFIRRHRILLDAEPIYG